MFLSIGIFCALYVVSCGDYPTDLPTSETARWLKTQMTQSLKHRREYDESKNGNPDRSSIYSSECDMETSESIEILRNVTKAVNHFISGWTNHPSQADLYRLLERLQEGIKIKNALLTLYNFGTSAKKLAPYVEMIRLTSWTCWFRSSVATSLFRPLIGHCGRIAPEPPRLTHPVFRAFYDATGFEYNECAHYFASQTIINFKKDSTDVEKFCAVGGIRPHEIFIRLALWHKHCDYVCANALAFALLARSPLTHRYPYFDLSALPSAQQALRRGLSLLPEKALRAPT